MPYTYAGVRRPTKREKAELKKQTILDEFSRTAELYGYDEITFSLAGAKHFGFSIYWNICKAGHIGEFSLRGECKTCVSISRGIRDAKTRGGTILKLTEAEKKQISDLYRIARKLTRDTGERHDVDHIKPLSAGGAHHHSNLRVILATENLKKGSKYNGKDRFFKKSEKAEIANRIQDEKDGMLGEIMAEREKVANRKYEEALAQYLKKPLLSRLFSKRPQKKSFQ